MARDTSGRRRAPSGLPYALNVQNILGGLAVPAHVGLNVGAGSFAHAFWLSTQPAPAASATATIIKYGTAGADANYWRYYKIGTIFYLITHGGTQFSTNVLAPTLSQPVRAFIVWDAADWKVRIYINAVLKYTSAALTPWSFTDGRGIFAGVSDLAGFIGMFGDLICVKGYAPTLSDVEADYYANVQPPSAVLRFAMSEGSGTTTVDTIAGVTATFVGTAATRPAWQAFEPARATSAARDTSTARDIAA